MLGLSGGLLAELTTAHLLFRKLSLTPSLRSLMTLSQVPSRFSPLATGALQIVQHVVYTGQSQYPAGPSNDPDTIDSFAAVTAYLRSRLLDTFSAAAASMAMRPSLHEAYINLLNLLSSTAETPGANHSFLLLGARGTGKSLVRKHSFSHTPLRFACAILQHMYHKLHLYCKLLLPPTSSYHNMTGPECKLCRAQAAMLCDKSAASAGSSASPGRAECKVQY